MKTVQEWVDLYNSDEFKNRYLYQGDDLGARCSIGLTTIKLWSPVADAVTVNFYKDGEATTRPYWTSPMRQGNQGAWEWNIHESLNGTYYDFTVTIDGVSQRTGDPYAKATGINGLRSMVLDLHDTNPVDWGSDKPPIPESEQIIDEIHIKEFSWHPAGGWPADVRGKYKALAVDSTYINNDGIHPTGLAFLKQMGITHVQLMPIYDYGAVDETGDDNQFNWGYDPVNYNVPDGSYATDAHHGEVRIRELKEAIQAIHRQGLGVIMDVVYNHTWNLDNPLQKTVPYYFYRTWPDGNLSNGSGCGNDIASERPMVEKYITDSVMYWAREYHIDGFRFDLMGLLTVDLMNRIRNKLDEKYGAGVKLVYGEPWAADKTAVGEAIKLADKGNFADLSDHVGMFCDDTRDTIKGSAGDTRATGFVNGADGVEGKLLNCVTGWCHDGSAIHNPAQIINYVSAHDNQTLWDKLTSTTLDVDLRRRQYRLAVAIYMTCQGRLFMLSGESFCRTKGGHTNSHDAPIEINQLDWSKIIDEQDMVDYYRGLIALRKQLPGLYDKSPTAHTRIGNTWSQPGIVGYMVDNTDDNSSSPWEYLCIVYNRNQDGCNVELGEGDWEVLATGHDSWLWQNPQVVQGHYEVEPVNWVMLRQRHEESH